MRTTKSEALEAVHETAMGLHKAGVINQVTLCEFEKLCQQPIETLRVEKLKSRLFGKDKLQTDS